ncbi:HIT family protein [Diaphorobacter sp. HDW4B]|uniref:HIT family protein n=1 Tax=Diaphorobacter sp. HDW4B TaxID=2714925 RepID=UPI001407DBC0|nr:HIT family protein [Diaphorobacter sp. HDW4B]QIL69849.1 HIT family protein [Diaphorobacter sp. HDW4B]
MTTTAAQCVLCAQDGGALIWRGEKLRLIRAVEEGFPAFYRVIWNAHAAELSDLSDDDRNLCMKAVAAVERVMRDTLAPTKINLAALGNMVPHLHWHVIARFDWDSHFPASVWANAQRPRNADKEAAVAAQLSLLDAQLAERLSAQFG